MMIRPVEAVVEAPMVSCARPDGVEVPMANWLEMVVGETTEPLTDQPEALPPPVIQVPETAKQPPEVRLMPPAKVEVAVPVTAKVVVVELVVVAEIARTPPDESTEKRLEALLP